MLIDAIDAVYRIDIKGKIYRLLFKMNSDTVIRVKTAVGMTKEEETGANVSQGTIEGAIIFISAASIDKGVNDAFKHSDKEASYGSEPLQPLLFQDDVSRVLFYVTSAQHSNDLMDSAMESKLLDL